jgi:hypothetical protein
LGLISIEFGLTLRIRPRADFASSRLVRHAESYCFSRLSGSPSPFSTYR